jgi:hypothetical protein
MKRLALIFCIELLSVNAWGLGPLLSGHFSLQGGLPKSEGHLRLTTIPEITFASILISG